MRLCYVITVLFYGFLSVFSCSPVYGAPFEVKEKEYWIKIDKNTLKMNLIQGSGDIIHTWPVAIGRVAGDEKKSRTDLITPAGVFNVIRILDDATQLIFDPKWFEEQGEPQKGAYGTKLISFKNPWQLAIHGTSNPRSVGRRITHGCIRLRNKDIEKLVTYIKPGTKIWITKLEKKQPAGKTAEKPQGVKPTPAVKPGVIEDSI